MSDNKQKQLLKIFKPSWDIQILELPDTKYRITAVKRLKK